MTAPRRASSPRQMPTAVGQRGAIRVARRVVDAIAAAPASTIGWRPEGRVADNNPPPQPLRLSAHQNGRSIPMALSLRDSALGDSKNSVRATLNSLSHTLSGHFV